MNNMILRIALNTPLRRVFDYLPVDPLKTLQKGIRVLVPFGSRSMVGILIECVHKTDLPKNKLRKAYAYLDEEPFFSEDVLELCFWAHDYYHYPLGEILSSALPGHLRKNGKNAQLLPDLSLANIHHEIASQPKEVPLELNDEQKHAVNVILSQQNVFKTFLLDGVTGSGKTEVYLHIIQEIIKNNDAQVLVLIPEINLTPQTIARFNNRFHVPIVALHSSMPEKEKLIAWQKARSGYAKIIIGTRSAVFIALKNCRLIIVDEEHDASFKQQDRFRYHARDIAIKRASLNNIPIILGSATPSLESLYNVTQKRYERLLLTKRAGAADLPLFEFIDQKLFETKEGLTQPLLNAIKESLESGNQVMLFLNRRGYAPVLYCTSCLKSVKCTFCDVALVYHRHPPLLHCHHCDAKEKVRQVCPYCKESNLKTLGVGTQKIEEFLAEFFKGTKIIRIDRDTTKKKNALNDILDEIHAYPQAILLGTQMLAKGHHFPNVTLVGILNIDHSLFSVNFRAAELLGQLFLQVAGRAGRAQKKGKVMIQTKHPEHPLLEVLVKEGFSTFANNLLLERMHSKLPPYSYLALIRTQSRNKMDAVNFLNAVKNEFQNQEEVIISGPVSAILARKNNLFHEHLIIKSSTRKKLQQFIKKHLEALEGLSKNFKVKWVLDIDPLEI